MFLMIVPACWLMLKTFHFLGTIIIIRKHPNISLWSQGSRIDPPKIPRHSARHPYNTRLKAKIMGEEHSAEMEAMKKNIEMVQDQMTKNIEAMQGQMTKMVEMMANLQKGKGTAEDSSSLGHRQLQSQEEPLYPPGFGPHVSTPPGAFQVPTSIVGGLGHPGMTPSGQPPVPNLTIPVPHTSTSIPVPNLDDPRELERLKNITAESAENPGGQKKYDQLEERLRAVEGIDAYGSVDAFELSLVPDVVIPSKFKVPDFEKYDGTKCPKAHVTMYCRKMAAHARNDKLLIHCFQDSLKESAIRWYNQLNKNQIQCWKDLARSFIAQYQHVADMAPDRVALQNMEKKEAESFKEYARRWRDVASQVQPPLTDKEKSSLFVGTLKGPYLDKMIGNASLNFADLVRSGELIENALKNGKIEEEPKKGTTSKKKDGEAQVIEGQHPGGFTPFYPYPSYYPPAVNHIAQSQHPYQLNYPVNPQVHIQARTLVPTTMQSPVSKAVVQPNTTWNNQRTPRERIPIDPIPVSYTELFPKLLEARLVAPIHLEPLKPPYPKWYDINAHCDYHAGLAGHSLENCTAFKYKVQSLVKAKAIDFEKENEPNVSGNLLPDHSGATVNALEIEGGYYAKQVVGEIDTPKNAGS